MIGNIAGLIFSGFDKTIYHRGRKIEDRISAHIVE